MTAPLPFRCARAAAFAAVCVALGLLAHLLAAGLPPTRIVAAGLAVSFLAALPALGRERTLRTILPLLAGLQVVLHVLFTLGHPVAAAAPPAAAGHVHAHAAVPADLTMVILHGCAVALTALWLAWGEALLWAALRHLALRFVPILLAWVLPERAPRPVVPFGEPRPPLQALLRHTVSRRGPPLPL
ncbi:MAG TPA: MFS transporter [Thermomonospora sp.]|nr:MFS transporter [Thermomonospora sp.]